jgi:hypothetical protein
MSQAVTQNEQLEVQPVSQPEPDTFPALETDAPFYDTNPDFLRPSSGQITTYDESEVVKLEVEIQARLVTNVEAFNKANNFVKRRQSDVEDMRSRLTYDFAVFKAIKVGRGRNGEWSKFVTENLKMNVRTVDRWIEDKLDGKKLDNVELPTWVVVRLNGNRKHDDPPTPPPPPPPMLKLVLPMTEENIQKFNRAAARIGIDVLVDVVFEAVVNHPEANKPTLAFLDNEEVIVGANDESPLSVAETLEAAAATGAM